MNKFFQVLKANSFGSRDHQLFPFYEGLEVQRQHYSARKREIEELVFILKLRAEAEKQYATHLYRIAERDNPENQFKFGLLAKEVHCFKQDCI